MYEIWFDSYGPRTVRLSRNPLPPRFLNPNFSILNLHLEQELKLQEGELQQQEKKPQPKRQKLSVTLPKLKSDSGSEVTESLKSF